MRAASAIERKARGAGSSVRDRTFRCPPGDDDALTSAALRCVASPNRFTGRDAGPRERTFSQVLEVHKAVDQLLLEQRWIGELHPAHDLPGAICPTLRFTLADIGSRQHCQPLSLYIAQHTGRVAADGPEKLDEYGQSLLESAWGATSLRSECVLQQLVPFAGMGGRNLDGLQLGQTQRLFDTQSVRDQPFGFSKRVEHAVPRPSMIPAHPHHMD